MNQQQGGTCGNTHWSYWGKATPRQDGECHEHAFAYHSLDVVAVADAWITLSKSIQRLFHTSYAWVRFFIALHDFGKLGIRFQSRAPDAIRRLGNYPEIPDVVFREEAKSPYFHGPEGFGLMKEELSTYLELDPSEYYPRWERWAPWMGAVAGHHGAICVARQASHTGVEDDKAARLEWIQVCAKLFLEPVGLSLHDDPPPLSAAMQSVLAGFCSVCDWLGSNEHFEYRNTPTDDLNKYLEERTQHAHTLLRESGIVRQALTTGGIEAVLNPDHSPRQVQRYVDALPLSGGLTVIEAPTGSGKTEAALGYAARLLAAGVADGVIFALPTQATANAMLSRLKDIAPRLFPKTDSSIVLAHGRARFNREAKQLRIRPTVQGDEEATVHQAEWLAQSRKRVFLGQIGVCTVDQVLLSVLPVRHHFVRSFSVGRNVLIVDEVHAYDAYMYGLLHSVLEQQRAAGGPVILLSATLPWHQRRQLIQSWQENAEIPEDNAYPLITYVTDTQIQTIRLRPEDAPPPRTVFFEPRRVRGFFPDEALLHRLIEAAEAGARVAVIVNLVDVAQQLVRMLHERTDVPVDLFHARFRFRDRMTREEEILERYGKKERLAREKSGVTDGRGRILVGTQVIEQSLDLDFDWMVTQLCPVDLLFQRIGRLHRDTTLCRPPGFELPRCTVLLGLPDEGYDLHGVIYSNQRALWRTEQLLLQVEDGKPVHFPDAYREWIEPVYQEEDCDEPEAVQRAYDKYWITQNTARVLARSISNERHVHNDTNAKIAALTRDGERSLSVLPVLAGATPTTLLGGSTLKSLGEFEQAEEVMLETINVPKGWEHHLPPANEEGMIHLPFQVEAPGTWVAQRDKTILRYSEEYGLEKTDV